MLDPFGPRHSRGRGRDRKATLHCSRRRSSSAAPNRYTSGAWAAVEVSEVREVLDRLAEAIRAAATASPIRTTTGSEDIEYCTRITYSGFAAESTATRERLWKRPRPGSDQVALPKMDVNGPNVLRGLW